MRKNLVLESSLEKRPPRSDRFRASGLPCGDPLSSPFTHGNAVPSHAGVWEPAGQSERQTFSKPGKVFHRQACRERRKYSSTE